MIQRARVVQRVDPPQCLECPVQVQLLSYIPIGVGVCCGYAVCVAGEGEGAAGVGVD